MGLIDAIASRWVRAPADLGDEPRDRVRLLDSPILAHLGRALDEDHWTAADLVAGRVPPYVRPPHPFRRFIEERDAHRALQHVGSPLRVLSYNVALLDRAYLLTRVRMPEVPARREVLWDVVLADDWDLVLLQEVWDDADLERLEAAGARHGYRVFGGTQRHHHQHGLAIAARADAFEPADGVRTEGQFTTQYPLEQWPGPDVKRGFLGWRLRHRASGRAVHAWTTHMTPFPLYWRHRCHQARELGRLVARAPHDEVVVLGGDTNAGPWYPADTWTRSDGSTFAGLWSNASSYALLRHYGDLRDSAVLAADAWRPDHDLWTADDRNPLFARSYAGDEPRCRMDLVLFRGASVAAERASLEYTEPHDFGRRGRFTLSDHYGAGATLRLAEP